MLRSLALILWGFRKWLAGEGVAVHTFCCALPLLLRGMVSSSTAQLTDWSASVAPSEFLGDGVGPGLQISLTAVASSPVFSKLSDLLSCCQKVIAAVVVGGLWWWQALSNGWVRSFWDPISCL